MMAGVRVAVVPNERTSALESASTLDAGRSHFDAEAAATQLVLAGLGVAEEQSQPIAGATPRWPGGVVGSVAWCRPVAVAAATTTRYWRGLGLAVQATGERSVLAVASALIEEELQWLASRPAAWSLAAFCAKSSVRDGLAAYCGSELDFQDFAVLPTWRGWRPAPRSARAVEAFSGLRWRGRWAIARGVTFALVGFR